MQAIQNRQLINVPWLLDCPYTGKRDTHSNTAVALRIVPLQDWLETAQNNGIEDLSRGVFLDPRDAVEQITDRLDAFSVIALDFSNFAEGRCYSQAVELRKRYGFKGDILAVGIAVDNLALGERCGVNVFLLADGEDIDDALGYFGEIEPVYSFV